MKYLWYIAAALFGVAAVSIFLAFQQPQFVAGLTAAAIGALLAAIKPNLFKLLKIVTKRKSLKEEAVDRDYTKMGEKRPNKFQRHPGEGRNG